VNRVAYAMHPRRRLVLYWYCADVRVQLVCSAQANGGSQRAVHVQKFSRESVRLPDVCTLRSLVEGSYLLGGLRQVLQ
jgi:hypothetical protein